ncbi:MAG: protein kinase [Proteobacteria bacterium]|nr:protein kinase [Pseudomonadota bacterium]
MSKQPSFSSSATSSSLGPRFDSGIQQSVDRFSGSTESKGAGWEIPYNELKFGTFLGQGTYGRVYTGIYRGIKVAIKVYNLRNTLPNKQQMEVLKEAGLMARLPKSPCLIGLHGISFDQNYCLVMEYAEGGTLHARLEASGELTLPQQMRWAIQISHGLNQLHSLNILHRDLTSRNILLNNREEAKVGDFGLSIIKSTSASHEKISSAMGTAGTLPWMAPELHNGESNSKKTDVYSLGVVLWEIVSRKMPYEGLMMSQMISMAVQGKRDPLPTSCPEIFRLMIMACYHLDAKQRPTAEQVGNQFETALRSLESLPSSLSPKGSDLKNIRSSVKNLNISKKIKAIYVEAKKDKNLLSFTSTVARQTPSPSPFLQDSSLMTVLPSSQQHQSDAKLLDQSSALILQKKDESFSYNPFAFTPRSIDLQHVEKAGNLLRLVTEGEQEYAENLIFKNPELLLISGCVTDLSERTFQKITPFQYALWAMDWHMIKMILGYLSPEMAIQQLEQLENEGTEHGKQFSLTSLIDALGEYLIKYNSSEWKELESYWAKVGELQRLLPVHIVNEYCRSDRSFVPCPSFVEATLPRTRRIMYEHKNEEMGEIRLIERGEWYTYRFRNYTRSGFFRNSHGGATATHIQITDSLGIEVLFSFLIPFALLALPHVMTDAPYDLDVRPDLIALQKLLKVRTEQINALKSQLQSKTLLQTSAFNSMNTSIPSAFKITDSKRPEQRQLLLPQNTTAPSPKTTTSSLELKKSISKIGQISPVSQNLYSLTAPKPTDKVSVNQKAPSQLLNSQLLPSPSNNNLFEF